MAGRTKGTRPDEGDSARADDYRNVPESWFREVGIPDEDIPALLAEYARGAPGRERWEHIAQEWECKEAERRDREWRTAHGLPPWAAPPKLTVAALREEIRQRQLEWITDREDRPSDLFFAPLCLARWWDAARLIEGAPAPPLMPAPLPGRLSDIQQALGAADVLLQWCDQADVPKHPVAHLRQIIQFNQTNNNAGDVNNAISERGDVVQTMGTSNAVQVGHPKESFWPTTAKGENLPETRFCKTALLALRSRAEKAASDFPSLWHMLVLPGGESLWVPERPGCHAVGSFRSVPTGPKCTFGTSHLIGPLPPAVCWPQDLEPVCAVVAEPEFLPFRPLAHKPYRIHLFFGHGEGQAAFELLAADIVNLSTDIRRALDLRLGGVFYHANDSLHNEKAAILDSWLCTIHWWAWKATDSPLHTSPKVVFGGTGVESHRMDEAVGQKLSYSLVNCDVFTATARTIDLFLRFFDVRPNLVYAVDYPEPQTTIEKEGSDDRGITTAIVVACRQDGARRNGRDDGRTAQFHRSRP